MSDGRVVVGIDGSEQGRVALRKAIDKGVRRRVPVDIVYVTDVTEAILHLPGGVVVNTGDLARTQREGVWGSAADLIEAADAEVSRVDLDGYPADVLVDYCDQVDAALLVLGTRGRGKLASTFLGSTSLRALERARCDVLVAKGT